jgi:hypothetical protein
VRSNALSEFVTIGIVIAGLTGLFYQGLLYTRETYRVLSAPTDWLMDRNDLLTIPVWISLAALLTGVVLLVGRTRNTETATLAHHDGR